MIQRLMLCCLLLVLVGCGGGSRVSSGSSSLSNMPSDDTTQPVTPPIQPVTPKLANADPNIKTMQLGDTTYDVLYTDASFYPNEPTGFNANTLVDTFVEDPQFTADSTITLDEGQTQVIFTDAKGDWPPIQVGFY
jgi:hypothetical protein